ncbi:flagellar hook-length control protein FliK [Rhizobium leucaenae]|uniref:Chemotaxis protein MotD n=1 Tax=Rhizobium leucaenae TaxID=29450 RepID=A0A7W6ZRC1_9HYPH|nr:flagellar hook-length control protein FliK [Rhizobium leucaenae]MBB4567309.1 chemotaxis protein MotD [Rhizobium leucaenae]MBB6303057.1 chemotaxis protein MotD [Rhizobium leucaenae]
MMDIGIASAPPGADLVAVAKGGRSAKQDDSDGKGFLDALTSSRGNGRKSDTTAQDDTDTTDAATGTDSGTDADANTVKNSAGDPTATAPATDDSGIGAGMIDPSAANIAALADLAKGSKQPGVAKLPQGADAALSKSLVDLQKPAEVDTDIASADKAQATPASNADAAKILGQAQAQTSDQLDDIAAQQLADVIAGNQPAQSNGDGKTQAPGKTSKTTSTDDDGKDSATQGMQSSGAASDALSLLNVPQTAAGVIAAAPQNAANVFAGADTKTQAEPDQPLPKLADVALKDASANATDADTTPSVAADATATAQTFRLVRADGRGGALEMSISKTSSDDTAQVDVKASSGGNAETVTVLDSRRYLGLAANSNAALVTNALAGDGEWSGAMQPASALSNAASWTSTGKVVNTLKIQLHPNDLGQVTATMRLSGDQLSVDLKVQTSEAYRQLHADQSHMVDALRAQGYQVDNITVTLASNADQQSDSGRQSGFQGQSQQQSLLNQGQGGDARPRGQSYSGQQANGNDGNRGSSERGTEDGAAGTAQRLRSGDVYL